MGRPVNSDKIEHMRLVILLLIPVSLLSAISIRPASALEVSASGFTFSKPVRSFKDLRLAAVVPQSLDYSCGPASIATLLTYYFGDRITEQEIIRYLLLTGDLDKIKAQKGFSLLDLKNYCKFRGYRVTGYQGDLEFFAGLKQPVVVPVNIKEYDHFVVLRGVKGGRVFLADPALGRISMLKSQFERIWKGGIGLVITRGKKGRKGGPLSVSEDESPVSAGGQVPGMLNTGITGRAMRDGEY